MHYSTCKGEARGEGAEVRAEAIYRLPVPGSSRCRLEAFLEAASVSGSGVQLDLAAHHAARGLTEEHIDVPVAVIVTWRPK